MRLLLETLSPHTAAAGVPRKLPALLERLAEGDHVHRREDALVAARLERPRGAQQHLVRGPRALRRPPQLLQQPREEVRQVRRPPRCGEI
jgi:hypothetical protein